MSKDEYNELKKNLLAFVERVCQGEKVLPGEAEALPAVVSILINTFCY